MATLYEHGTLAMLMAGNLAGTQTLGELLKHGSYGLGTFDGLDGEVVILDGEVYQADASGKVNHITDMQTTLPFASVHFPENEIPLKVGENDFASLTSNLTKSYQLANVFAYVKLDGVLDQVKIRIAPKQSKPYPGLLEVAKHQPTFEASAIAGSVVGYYAPDIFGTVTAGGWHLHFISDDRSFSGHILSLSTKGLSGKLEIFDSFEQHLPIENPEFRQMQVDTASLQAGIEAAEH